MVVESNRDDETRPGGRAVEALAGKRPAVIHGIPGEVLILPGEFAAEARERMGFYRNRLLPDHPLEEWYFARYCVEAVRIDQGVHAVAAAKVEQASRAAEAWDDDRGIEVERLAADLPRRPERVRPSLLETRQGAAWLLDRWRVLERKVTRHGTIAPAVAAAALDLLGVARADRSEALADRLGVEPEPPAEAGPATAGAAPRTATESFAGPEAMAAWASLVAAQTADLERRIGTYLADRDGRSRALAEAGLGPDGPEVRALIRHEARLSRSQASCLRELRRLQRRDRQAELFGDPPARSAPDRPTRSPRVDAPSPSPDPDNKDPHGPPAVPTDRPSPSPAGTSPAGTPADRPAPASPAAPMATDPASAATAEPTGKPETPTAPVASTGKTETPMSPREVWDRLSPGTQAMIRRLDAAAGPTLRRQHGPSEPRDPDRPRP